MILLACHVVALPLSLSRSPYRDRFERTYGEGMARYQHEYYTEVHLKPKQKQPPFERGDRNDGDDDEHNGDPPGPPGPSGPPLEPPPPGPAPPGPTPGPMLILYVVGTRPDCAGAGHGELLVRQCLEYARRLCSQPKQQEKCANTQEGSTTTGVSKTNTPPHTHTTVYLEATSERSRTLYERCGFRATGTRITPSTTTNRSAFFFHSKSSASQQPQPQPQREPPSMYPMVCVVGDGDVHGDVVVKDVDKDKDDHNKR